MLSDEMTAFWWEMLVPENDDESRLQWCDRETRRAGAMQLPAMVCSLMRPLKPMKTSNMDVIAVPLSLY